MDVPNCGQCQCEVCSSSALLSPIQGLLDAVAPSDTRGLARVSNHRRLRVSVPLRNDVPESSSGNRASREKHPQRAKEGFWAAAKLIPALIFTKINPELCDRSRGAHQHLKPDMTEIPLHLHMAAPSLWTRACTAWDSFGPGLVEFVLNPPLDKLSLQFQKRSSVAQHSLADDEGTQSNFGNTNWHGESLFGLGRTAHTFGARMCKDFCSQTEIPCADRL